MLARGGGKKTFRGMVDYQMKWDMELDSWTDFFFRLKFSFSGFVPVYVSQSQAFDIFSSHIIVPNRTDDDDYDYEAKRIGWHIRLSMVKERGRVCKSKNRWFKSFPSANVTAPCLFNHQKQPCVAPLVRPRNPLCKSARLWFLFPYTQINKQGTDQFCARGHS